MRLRCVAPEVSARYDEWVHRNVGAAVLAFDPLPRGWWDVRRFSRFSRIASFTGGGLRCGATDYLTPTPPTPLRTFYIDAATGNDSNDGLTLGTPWLTLQKFQNIAIPGDCAFCNGTFTGINNRLGSPGRAGTAANPIQIRPTIGQGSTTFQGGDVNYPPVWLNSTNAHWWIQDIRIQANGVYSNNPSQGIEVVPGGVAAHTLVRLLFINASIKLNGAPDTTLWDCNWNGTVGSFAANAGDFLFIQNGSNRLKIIRPTIQGASGHSAITVTFNGGPGEPTCDDIIFYGGYVQNTASAGMILNGKCVRPTVSCFDFIDCGTDAYGTISSQMGLELECTNGTFFWIRIINAYTDAIQIQGRTALGVLQNANGNNLYQISALKCGGSELQFVLRDVGRPYNNTIRGLIGWKCNLRGLRTDNGISYSVWVDAFNANSSTNPSPGYGDLWTTVSALGNVVAWCDLSHTGTDSAISAVLVVRIQGNGGNLPYTIAQAQANWAGWQGSIRQDPKFRSEVIPYDLALQGSSPCIDALTDATLAVSFNGLDKDMGAWEYP